MSVRKRKSVTDEVNEEFADTEIAQTEDYNESSPRVAEFDADEYDISTHSSKRIFGKQHVKLLADESKKYKGKIVSRKKFKRDLSPETSMETTNIETGTDSSCSNSDGDSGGESINSDSDSNDSYNEKGNKKAKYSEESYSSEEEDEKTASESISNEESAARKKRQEMEIKKGTSVQNQLRIWEHLLKFRIMMQKILSRSNQLSTEEHKLHFASETAKKSAEQLCNLMKCLIELKTTLSSQYPELRSHLRGSLQEKPTINKCDNSGINLERFASYLEDEHIVMRSFRNAVILKWEDRTKLPAFGANSNAAKPREFDKPMESKEQKPNETKNVSPDAYDDTEFYRELLREVIDFKGSNFSNATEMAKQLAEQNDDRNKMKKKVDTRASKGRKIRYIVHNKLVNFMAPDDTTSINWPDEAKDELFKSLFAT